MEKLDQAYLTELVARAKREGGNAFAELFAATQPFLYTYIAAMMGEGEEADQVLGDVFAHALRGLASLANEVLFLPWMARICYRECASRSQKPGARLPRPEQPVATPEGTFPLSHLLNLPLTESQVMLMRYGQGLGETAIGDILNFSRRLVRQCLKSAGGHLRSHREGGRPEGGGERISPAGDTLSPAHLPADRATALLEEVFRRCGADPNTLPMEALAFYTVYRRERFSLQRGFLAGMLGLFLLLPLLFVLPKLVVSVEEQGERGLPVYTVEVSAVLPIRSVTARLASHRLPVYEAAARTFSVEPTRNGEMQISVELVNRQGVTATCRVTDVDAGAPALTDSESGEGRVVLRVEDAGIGVDFAEIFATGESGAVYLPVSWDEASGEVLFSYPEENWDVYIPDHIGNTLHLSLTLE